MTAARASRCSRVRQLSAWLGCALLVLAYAWLPEDELASNAAHDTDEERESSRVEIVDVSPRDPYQKSSIAVRYAGHTERGLHVYAGKARLHTLAVRDHEIVAALPDALAPGDVKVRLATDEEAAFVQRAVHSKPFRIRVRAPNLRKVFRQLIGGAALIVFGVGMLALAARRTAGLGAARWITRVARWRTASLATGTLLGVVTRSTTAAASLLSALVSSRVVPVRAAVLALLGAGLGAALSPLLVVSLVEPREGLLIVALGVVLRASSSERMLRALSSVLLGVGFVALGVQALRPGLEPYLSDAVLLRVADRLIVQDGSSLVLCVLLGSLSIAGLQGPGALMLLLLGWAQATGRFELRTSLALLAGSGLGGALSGLIPATTSERARTLAQLHLALGVVGTAAAALAIEPSIALADHVLGPLAKPLHYSEHIDAGALGLRLALTFGVTQLCALACALAAAPLAERALVERQSGATPTLNVAGGERLGAALDDVRTALDAVAALAQTGIRRHGRQAERHLRAARAELTDLLKVKRKDGAEEQSEDGTNFAALQLQQALESLHRRCERLIEARIGAIAADSEAVLPNACRSLLHELHALLVEGIASVQASLRVPQPLDLESARAREIHINRLEASARRSFAPHGTAPESFELALLQLVDAYEASGNQLYRLSELVGQRV